MRFAPVILMVPSRDSRSTSCSTTIGLLHHVVGSGVDDGTWFRGNNLPSAYASVVAGDGHDVVADAGAVSLCRPHVCDCL